MVDERKPGHIEEHSREDCRGGIGPVIHPKVNISCPGRALNCKTVLSKKLFDDMYGSSGALEKGEDSLKAYPATMSKSLSLNNSPLV